MQRIFFLLLLAVSGSAYCQLQTPADSVHFLLDTTIAIMKKKALYADKVQWNAVARELKEKTKGASSVQEAAFAFTRLFDELSDVHGAFFYKGATFRSTGKIKNVDKINEVTDTELRKGPKLVAQILPSKIAYLRIPVVLAQDTAGVVAYANRINDSLLNMLQQGAKGVIIDLRLNQGGNMYPMIAGLRSLFKEGIVSESYTYEFGNKNGSPVFFRHDSLITDYYQIKLNRYADYSHLPVAVLIGPSTASAGECTAASLTFRNKSVLLGEESMGLTNGNDGFLLLPDIGFNLAVGVLKNGNGQRLDEVIVPEIAVAGGDNFMSLKDDKKVQRAIAWIQKNR